MSAWPDEELCLYCGHATEPGDEVCAYCSASIVVEQYGPGAQRPQRGAPAGHDTRRRPRAGRRPAALRRVAVRAPRATRQGGMCGDVCPDQPYYVCTHRPGHHEDHAAHGEPYGVLATWPRDVREEV